ncbi:MAG: 30S ribosomal protein S17 [Minisyncoccia bacterium]
MSRTLTGVVKSNKGAKTIIVAVQTHKIHPLYKKRYLLTKRYMAHDSKNEAKVGDRVSITECRPLSANKRFMLTKVIEKAALSEEQRVEAVTAEDKPEVKK